MNETGRKIIFRWMAWFALANSIVLSIVGLRYFHGFTPGGTILSWIYLVLIYPAHHVMLAIIPLFILLTPVVLIWPEKRLTTAFAAVLFALQIALITLDSMLWQGSRFHLNGLTMQILGWQSWVFVTIIFVIAVCFEALLAKWVWQWTASKHRRSGRAIALIAVSAILSSQLIHAWADAAYYVPVTSVGQQLPVYKGFRARSTFVRLGMVDPDASRERQMAQRLSKQLDSSERGNLKYPLQELQCVNQQPLNLLLILSDALRFDMVTETNMPFLTNYGKQSAQQFQQHFSGGNSSRMGVFSLFYGLPPGYWASFESFQRSAVLLDVLQEQDYQLGVFTSSVIYRPVSLDKTAFANVVNVRRQTNPVDAPAWQRDQTMQEEWSRWLENRNINRPFFGFLFFDSTNAQQYPAELELVPGLQPENQQELSLEFANYRRSARFVDGLLESVISQLNTLGLAENTVVIITSDHGEEFDESGAGLRDHGSGYTRYQLQVPMIVHWPGKEPKIFHHRSSHYDIVPTLMQNLLGCQNDPADYSSGHDLFEARSWDWLLAGSYYNYAVLEPDQITVTYPNGQYEVRDWNYRILNKPNVRGDVLMSVSRENSRFYR